MSKEKRKQIGQYLKAMRTDNQKALADKLGTNQDAISRIENGGSNYGIDYFIRWLEIHKRWDGFVEFLKGK